MTTANISGAEVFTVDEDGTTVTDRGTSAFSHDNSSSGSQVFRAFCFIAKDIDNKTDPFAPIDIMYKNNFDVTFSDTATSYWFKYHIADLFYYTEVVDTDLLSATYLDGLTRVSIINFTKGVEFQTSMSDPDFPQDDFTFTLESRQASAVPISYNANNCYGLEMQFRFTDIAAPTVGYDYTHDFKLMSSYISLLPDSPFIIRHVDLPVSNNDDVNVQGIVY